MNISSIITARDFSQISNNYYYYYDYFVFQA